MKARAKVQETPPQSQPFPPPKRKPKRHLSIKAAVAVATKTEGHSAFKPLMNPINDFSSTHSSSPQEIEKHLLELQADIINREELLDQKEKQCKARELELNEQEALLEARRQIIESDANHLNKSLISDDAQDALQALKNTLDAQEASLKEAREILHEREAYIEQCENMLVEQSIALTEREARVEQKEEDFRNSLAKSPAGSEQSVASSLPESAPLNVSEDV